MGPRYLYLHGFASSPASKKAVAFREHFAHRGVHLESLDLRVPALERLLVSTMVDVTRKTIGDEHDRAVVIGSSLGALTAALAAERDARICALVLLAPAFGLVDRWRRRLGADGLRAWRESGWLTLPPDPDGPPRLHWQFLEDAMELERHGGPFADVRVPTLVLHGRRDDVVPIEGSRRFVAGKPHMRLVEVDDEHPLYGSIDIVNAEVDRFLFGLP